MNTLNGCINEVKAGAYNFGELASVFDGFLINPENPNGTRIFVIENPGAQI
jgi:hypothetical protein